MKRFSYQLAPLLIDVYNYSYRHGCLPATLLQALIHKKDQDPLNCTSYRPISLLPVDVKILSKVLANRIECIAPLIISEDQTGFIKGRHSFSNVRRLLDRIHASSSSIEPEAAISLDAEKAFDRVEWIYLFYAMQKFGFSNSFISWIKLLYTSPQAAICTNTQQSDFFPTLQRDMSGLPTFPFVICAGS